MQPAVALVLVCSPAQTCIFKENIRHVNVIVVRYINAYIVINSFIYFPDDRYINLLIALKVTESVLG